MTTARRLGVFAVATAVLSQLSWTAAATPAATTVVARSYPVGYETFPGPLAVDSKRGYVYTGPYQTGELAVLNTATGKVLDVPLHGETSAVVVDHANGLAYVVDAKQQGEGAGFVDVVRGTTHVATISLGLKAQPAGAVFDPHNQLLYVAESGTNRIAIVKGARLDGSIAVAAGPTQLALNPKTGDVFVSDTAAGRVSVIHGRALVGSVPVPAGPAGIAVDDTRDRTYVACPTANRVAILTGDRVTDELKMPKGSEPTSVAVAPATHTAYIGETGTYVDDGDFDTFPGSGYAVIHASRVVARHKLSDAESVSAVTAISGAGEALISLTGGYSRLIDRQGRSLARMPFTAGGPGQATSAHRIWTTDGVSNIERVDLK